MNHQRISVFITRPYELLQSALNVLPSNRFEVHPCPTVTISPIALPEEKISLLKNIADYDYIIFTSQHAVTETIKHCQAANIALSQFNETSICTAGPMVSQHLEKHGLHASLMPHQYTAQALAELIPNTRRPAKILLPMSNRPLGILAPLLRKKGYHIDMLEVFNVTFNDSLCSSLQLAIQKRSADCIIFTSPSSVVAFSRLAPQAQYTDIYQLTTFAAIGPTTRAACEQLGIQCDIMPDQYTLQSVARSVTTYYTKKQWQSNFSTMNTNT